MASPRYYARRLWRVESLTLLRLLEQSRLAPIKVHDDPHLMRPHLPVQSANSWLTDALQGNRDPCASDVQHLKEQALGF